MTALATRWLLLGWFPTIVGLLSVRVLLNATLALVRLRSAVVGAGDPSGLETVRHE